MTDWLLIVFLVGAGLLITALCTGLVIAGCFLVSIVAAAHGLFWGFLLAMGLVGGAAMLGALGGALVRDAPL